MKKYRWFYFLVLAVILLSGAAACGGGGTSSMTETFFPPQGAKIEVSTFSHEGVDYYVIKFPAGTQPDPRASALLRNADKSGEAGDGGFIIQIRKETVVDYVLSPENNSLAIEVLIK